MLASLLIGYSIVVYLWAIEKHNKSIEAALRGYFYFKVNNHRFYTYNSALNYKNNLVDTDIIFEGFNIIKGWRIFYMRCTNN